MCTHVIDVVSAGVFLRKLLRDLLGLPHSRLRRTSPYVHKYADMVCDACEREMFSSGFNGKR